LQEEKPFVATHATTRKAPAGTASINDDRSCDRSAGGAVVEGSAQLESCSLSTLGSGAAFNIISASSIPVTCAHGKTR
jgi:hypothetical protein